ncbi:MAG: hypothetical protein QMC96_07290 [Methanomicrobiales archaeon]|nr:hypothetical protein [Methanomicrobiales archaeon]
MIGIVPLIATLIAMEVFAFSERARAEWRGFFIAAQMADGTTVLGHGLWRVLPAFSEFLTQSAPCWQIARDHRCRDPPVPRESERGAGILCRNLESP